MISSMSESGFSTAVERIRAFDILPQTADLMIDASLKHLSPLLPVIHSPNIRDLHRRRDTLKDPYEESILLLVYALGGHFMETVSSI